MDTNTNNEASKIKELEDKLKEKDLFINTILENSPIGFAVNTISDGKVVFVSSNFEKIYGIEGNIINDTNDFFDKVYIDPAYRAKIKKRILDDINSGDVNKMKWANIPITTVSGIVKYVTASNIPIPEQNIMISTVQDVTENKLSEDAINDKINELEKMNRFLAEREMKMIELKNEITELKNNNHL